MNFLTGLGNFAGGAAQGIDRASQISQRAQQIQAAQFALDQAKKQTAADAMAFANLGGTNSSALASAQMPQSYGSPQIGGPELGPMTQPMAPGQPSVPQQGGPVPQAPATAPAPQAVLQPSQGSQPPMSPPGGATAPLPQGSGASSPQAPQASPAGIDPTDPMAGVKVVTQIAQEIKSRNPTIPPEQLLMATQRVIEMSKGMAPALRTGAQVVLQDMRDQVQTRGQDIRQATQERGQDIGASNVDKRVAATERGQDMANSRAMMQANAAMERVKVVQGELNKRFAAGQGTKAQQVAVKERIDAIKAQLTAASRKLSSLKDATGQPLPETDPRVIQATKEVADATNKLEVLQKTLKVAPAPAAAPVAEPDSGRPTATGPKGEKVEWDGKNWVPVKSSAAK